MKLPKHLALLPAFTLLLLVSLFHLFVAPYTKVEESFTLHAVWDILTYGLDIGKYDHWEFPGAVKRSFIPPLLLSSITYPLNLVPEINTQVAIRLALLSISQLLLYSFASTVAELYGLPTANFFLLFSAAQFHLQFYISRTLPNFLAFPIVVSGLSQFMIVDTPTTTLNLATRHLRLGSAFLISVGIIARSEILVLAGWAVLVDFILSPSKKRYLSAIVPSVVVSAILSTAASVSIDTKMWNCPSLPELEGLLFNVVKGHASDWGVEPWYYYWVSLPKLLLNPLVPFLAALSVVLAWKSSLFLSEIIGKLRYLIFVPLLYVGTFSILSHKEWRFIIYIIPLLTAAAAVSAAYVHTHRSKSLLFRLLHLTIVLSIPASLTASLAMGLISSMNYPGGMALDSLHTICNASSVRVYLDVPSRMTGATLPLCTRHGWTYTKSENETELNSTAYWQDVDFAIVGSLVEAPCKRGKGIEGKGEWDIVYRQKGYAGITWRPLQIPETFWNITTVKKLAEHERVQKISNFVKRHAARLSTVKVPWVKLEDKIFVLKHLRKEDLVERSIRFEVLKEKEREGLGKLGEIEGQWREFY